MIPVLRPWGEPGRGGREARFWSLAVPDVGDPRGVIRGRAARPTVAGGSETLPGAAAETSRGVVAKLSETLLPRGLGAGGAYTAVRNLTVGDAR